MQLHSRWEIILLHKKMNVPEPVSCVCIGYNLPTMMLKQGRDLGQQLAVALVDNSVTAEHHVMHILLPHYTYVNSVFTHTQY